MSDLPEVENLYNLLVSKKEKLTAMLAPSFPIDFPFPEIIGKLRRAGFTNVVEVAAGAVETNRQVLSILQNDPKKRIITSPCPSCVRFLKAKYPQLVSFLSQTDSPMTATAKMVLKKFPGTKPVFIGPCLTKKLEAKDNPELNILALTFKELALIFEKLGLGESTEDLVADFDLLGEKTRLYPISGGLCQTAGIDDILTQEEYRMVSGLNLLDEALAEFVQDTNIRVLDILFCEGGCIGGPGIISKEPLEERRYKVIKFWAVHLIPEK